MEANALLTPTETDKSNFSIKNTKQLFPQILKMNRSVLVIHKSRIVSLRNTSQLLGSYRFRSCFTSTVRHV